MRYTAEKRFTVEQIKEFAKKYNNANEFTDFGFMHTLFHGLDDIIERLEKNCVAREQLKNIMEGK